MFDKVLKNGSVFIDNKLQKLDLAINGEKIAEIGENLSGKEIFDVSGKWIMPGALDVHTHFSLPFAGAVSADDFFTGTRAGAFGGITTIIDFTAQEGDEGLIESIERRKSQAKDLAAIDYSFHPCIKNFSKGVKTDIPKLKEIGLPSLKIFMAYGKAGMMQRDPQIVEILSECKKNSVLVTTHAENGDIIDHLIDEHEKQNNLGIKFLPLTRPVYTETEAIRRLAEFSRVTDCPVYVVHVSSGEGAEAIKRERARGIKILGETGPQYLYLDNSRFNEPNGHYWSCCPPIREQQQQENIWNGLNEGHIAVTATDHCPFTQKDKDSWNGKITELPMGLPGIETLVPFTLWGVNTGKLSLEKAIKALTESPAKIFGLYPEKGSLKIGTDADILVYDPEKEVTIRSSELHMATDYSPFEGSIGKGWPVITFLKGKVIVQNGEWFGQKGAGNFLKRKTADLELFK